MKQNIFLILITVSITVFVACTKKASPGKSAVETSYQADIVPLLQAKCTPCHLPTKGGFKADFENFESAKKYASEMVKRVLMNPGERGFMPFKGTRLSEEEISVFKQWVDQGLTEK